MLQDKSSANPNPPPLPLRAPQVSPAVGAFEAEITLRTQSILRNMQRQIKVTRHEAEIDKLARQVVVRFAYDDRGINMLPVSYRRAFADTSGRWWGVLRYQLVGLVFEYYRAVLTHELDVYERDARRLEEMLDKGIYSYLLSPAEPVGHILRTKEEWSVIVAEKARREQEILDNKDRLERA